MMSTQFFVKPKILIAAYTYILKLLFTYFGIKKINQAIDNAFASPAERFVIRLVMVLGKRRYYHQI